MHNPFFFCIFAHYIFHFMKILLKYGLLSLLMFAFVDSYAQTTVSPVEIYVLGAAGGSSDQITTSSAQKIQVDWTIGEPIIETLKAARKQVTQGFHQNSLSGAKSTYVFSVLDHDNIQHFSIFPNPFISHFSVQWTFSENLNLLFEIFTTEGKRVFSKRQNAMDSQLQIMLPNLKPSTYILRISDPQRNFLETHKIVKL